MKCCLALMVLWVVCTTLIPALEMNKEEMQQAKGKFCGNHLADMLSLVCNGEYNNKQKRTVYRNHLGSSDDYDNVEPMDYSENSLVPFPFRSRERAKAIIPPGFRKSKRGGVVDECCHKSCSLWEMAGYCAEH